VAPLQRLVDGISQQELSDMFLPVQGLLNLYAMTNHPKLYLFEPFPPPFLEPFHPLAILRRVWNVNKQTHQIISVL